MTQWIILAIVLALCAFFIARRIWRRSQGSPCSNCSETDCKLRQAARRRKP